MRAIAISILSLALAGPAAAAETAMAGGTCADAVKVMQAEWKAVGYPLPTKQTQAFVPSADGHHASAAEVNHLRLLVRLAGEECAKGNQTVALEHVAAVRAAIETPDTMTAKRSAQ